ncbi:MAG TPA: hypothetical protein VIV58_27060, partial [Kofleriaceae bacterium]
MTPYKLASTLADALADCEWDRDALLARIAHIVGELAPWMRVVVDDALHELTPHAHRFEIAGDELESETPISDEIEELLSRHGYLEPEEELEEEPVDKRTQLVAWLMRQIAFRHAVARGARACRPWIPPPEMRESPWAVPALPTHGELARWFGISHDRLDILADRRNLSRDSRDPRARHYRYTWLAKRTGGHRLLEAP